LGLRHGLFCLCNEVAGFRHGLFCLRNGLVGLRHVLVSLHQALVGLRNGLAGLRHLLFSLHHEVIIFRKRFETCFHPEVSGQTGFGNQLISSKPVWLRENWFLCCVRSSDLTHTHPNRFHAVRFENLTELESHLV